MGEGVGVGVFGGLIVGVNDGIAVKVWVGTSVGSGGIVGVLVAGSESISLLWDESHPEMNREKKSPTIKSI